MLRALVLASLLCCGGDKRDFEPLEPDGTLAELQLDQGELATLTALRERRIQQLERRKDDANLIAQIAGLDGLLALLYGTPVPQEAVFAQQVAPGEPNHRSWVLGKVAFELTRVTKPEQLAELDTLLTDLAKTHQDDPWRRWLVARVALARGDRAAAEPILRALTIAPAKIGAYRVLADVQFALGGNRHEHAGEQLGKLGKQRNLPNECAFWKRVAWFHLQLGRAIDKTNDHKIASIARSKCAALGKATGVDHRLSLIDANLNLGIGRPEVALRIAATLPSHWGRVTHAYALLELGRPGEVEQGAAKIPGDGLAHRAHHIARIQARAQLAANRAAREPLVAELAAADRGSSDHRGSHAIGQVHLASGDLAAAQRTLRRVVEETTAERPDPFAYRTHQLLAEIAIALDDLPTAGKEIDRAIEIHPGNATSRVIQARIQLRAGQPERALEAMAPARKLGELTPAGKLVVAEALALLTSITDDQRSQARALIVEVAGKLPPAEVGRVAALVDPKLPGELKLPVGKLPKQKI